MIVAQLSNIDIEYRTLSLRFCGTCVRPRIYIRYTIQCHLPKYTNNPTEGESEKERTKGRERNSEPRRRALTACSAWIVIFLFSYVNRCQRHLLPNSLCHLTGLCLSFYFISFICQIIRFFLFQSNHTSSPVVRTHYTNIQYIDRTILWLLCVAATIHNFSDFKFAYFFCTFLGNSAVILSNEARKRKQYSSSTQTIAGLRRASARESVLMFSTQLKSIGRKKALDRK